MRDAPTVILSKEEMAALLGIGHPRRPAEQDDDFEEEVVAELVAMGKPEEPAKKS